VIALVKRRASGWIATSPPLWRLATRNGPSREYIYISGFDPKAVVPRLRYPPERSAETAVKIRKICVTKGVYWVEIADAGLRMLCGYEFILLMLT